MKRCLPIIVLGVVVALAAWAGTSNAVINIYVEDFTTTQYKDPVNTTAWWDTLTGELKLFPFVPTLLGNYDTPGIAYGVVVSGDHAFVADGGSGLQVIDISDPTNSTLAGNYDTPGTAFGVAVSGDHAFVADFTFGLLVIDISDPTNPMLVGTYNTPGRARGVAVSQVRGSGIRQCYRYLHLVDYRVWYDDDQHQ